MTGPVETKPGAPRAHAGALRDLLARFQGYLFDPSEDIADLVVSTARVSSAVRVRVYAESYRLRLVGAMRIDFPALYALLGDETFDRLGRAYIDAYPSHHFSIRWFGGHLSRFLAEAAPYCERPDLSELAAFEWALSEAFDAADTTSVADGELAALPAAAWPQMRLRLHPSVRRIDLRTNVPLLWKAITEGRPRPSTEISEYPLGWLIWRRALKTFFRSLPVHEAWALDAARAGLPFADICEGLCEWVAYSEVALKAASLLRVWERDGLIAEIKQD